MYVYAVDISFYNNKLHAKIALMIIVQIWKIFIFRFTKQSHQVKYEHKKVLYCVHIIQLGEAVSPLPRLN